MSGADLGWAQHWNAVRALLGARQGDPPLAAVSRTDVLPASFAQERLWFLDRWSPGSTAYNLAVACRLAGPLDVAALERSLTELVGRHEILRTTLGMAGAALAQHIGPARAVTLPIEETSEVDIERWARHQAGQPFDLERGPLFRASLAKIAASHHCLVLAMHHAIFDAWSFEIFMAELCACYDANTRGQGPSLPPVALQYADYAHWQRRRISGAMRDRLIAHWEQRLGDGLAPLQLVADHPRAPFADRRGASQSVTVRRELCDALESLARREGATSFVILLAAFKTLLYRYTGEVDVVIGSPVANRNRAELRTMLGMFANTLALRTNLGGEPTFRHLVARVRETVTDAMAYQDLPFELLVKAVRPHRFPDVPSIGVAFAYQNVPRTGWRMPGLAVHAWNIEPDRAKFDLTLTVQQKTDGLNLLLEYDADLFDDSTVGALLRHLVTLLGAVAADPDDRISRLQLIEASERQRLLIEENEIGKVVPPDMTVHEGFEAQVRRNPFGTAVVAATESISYDDLNRRANRLASRLVALELGAEPLVGVCLDRSPSLVVALLAILKAGGAYVPVAPSDPGPHRARLLRDVAAIVTDVANDALVSEIDAPRIRVDDACWFDEEDSQAPGPGPQAPAVARECSPDSLAYVMFTSGSTGAPRGVCVPHRAVMRLVQNTDYARFGPDEVFLQLAPPAFDASTFEIWGALLNGARLVLAPPHQPSITEIGDLIARERVTTLWLISGLFELFVDSGLEPLASVRQLLSGGDVMSIRHAERFLHELPGCRLINCYGPTENTTFTSTHAVESVEPGRSIPIGRPIPGTRVYLLDGNLQPVPLGVAAEVFVGGVGLARGYLNDPEQTRQRFIASPVADGEVLYKTGDRARRRADGVLEFIGRIDDQIKILGHRVEPAEVERVLREFPDIKTAAVRADVCATGRRCLIAYVAAPAPDEDLRGRLRNYLQARLPSYMLPAEFVFVPELPSSHSGKLDRRALPLPIPRPVAAAVRPRTASEQALVEIFAKTLKLDSVGVHDNFFDGGGDSLSAMAIGVAIERMTGRAFPLATLFEKPTVAQLAQEIAGSCPVLVVPDRYVVQIKEGGTDRPLFLVAGGHGGKAELMICAKLVSRLRSTDAVFGLMAPVGCRTVEEIAAVHVASIQRLQPRGPYRIGGECIGGVVAYEVAQQLRADGADVELLLLLDTWCPTTVGVVHHNLIGRPLARLKGGWAVLAGLPRRDQNPEPWLSELRRRAVAPREARLHMRACMRYRPGTFPGRITILASEANLRRGLSTSWETLAGGGLLIHRAPGDHQSYSRQYFRQTAEQLRVCLEGRSGEEEGT